MWMGMWISGMGLAATQGGEAPPLKWFKGNTHTHTWWSDGDSPPETVAAWYKEHDYDFLVLSEHNILAEGVKWYPIKEKNQKAALATYREQFGDDWVQTRTHDGKTEVKLKTFREYRSLFEDAGKFIFIEGEEITDLYAEKHPVHLNGLNLTELIPPQGGASVAEMIQRNVDAVLDQSIKTGQPMLVHLNHPNFYWAVRVEDIIPIRGEKFFEVYNGHVAVRNYGDDLHPSLERMWDVVLAKRLGEKNLPVMYGVATDDAHTYTSWGIRDENPGRGWVMVRARRLTPNSIINAMNSGDFYASTGVTLRDFAFDGKTLKVEIDPQPGVKYTVAFIGTKKGFDPKGTPRSTDKDAYVSMRYSDEIGVVLSETAGTSASYTLTGEELYVRAKITSDKKQANPYGQGDLEAAWVQPVVQGESIEKE
jgi:hypothetical protein